MRSQEDLTASGSLVVTPKAHPHILIPAVFARAKLRTRLD